MRTQLIDVALGHQPADLVIKGGKFVNVLTREIYPAGVATAGDRVAATGDVSYAVGPETTVLDASGRYITPGLIDQHLHVHETQLNIVELAAAVLPHGTTGICTDFYGEMVVGGVKAVRTCLDAAQTVPLHVWFVLGTPGYYQNLPFGHSGWPTRDEMLEMLSWPECYGMDDTFAAKVAAKDPKILELVDAVRQQGKKVCGHVSEIVGRPLNAFAAYAGATDDHECTTAEEAVEKARAGLHVAMREGSGCFNVRAVVKAVTELGVDPRRFCFSTDLISPLQIARSGHIDNALRVAIRSGLPPLVAIQMATLNAAECLKIDEDYGSVSPGKVADIVLVDDLATFGVTDVVAGGEIVVRDRKLVADFPPVAFPEWAYGTVRFSRPLEANHFAIEVADSREVVNIRVISARGDSLVTKEIHEEISVRNGRVAADLDHDILKIAAIERVKGTGEIGVGLIRGFGLKRGAIATTYNSQQQNLIVLGADDADMALAANTVREAGGGFAIVEGGSVRAILELPLFGLESDESYGHVLSRLQELDAVLAELGCNLPAAFHTLGFMGLPVDIGTLKISPQGLVDVWAEETVPLQAERDSDEPIG